MPSTTPPPEAGADAALYACRGIALTPLDSRRTLVTTLADRERVIVDAGVARLAGACQTFRTLREHAAAAGESGASGEDVMPLLRALVDGGLLVSKQRFVEVMQAEAPAETATVLRTIAMPTCHRVDAMRRGLDSYLANAIRHGHAVRAIVADDTCDPRVRDRCRHVLASLARRHDREIRYAGPVEKRAFIDRLATAGDIDCAVLEFALFGCAGSGRTFGANRNALHLAAAGEAYFCADDDTVGMLVAPDDVEPGVRLSSLHDPTRLRIVPPGAAFPGQPREIDLLAMHRRVLGRSVCEVIPSSHQEIDLGQCDAALMTRLERGGCRIRLSWMGIAGDPGTGSAPHPMHHPGTDRSGIENDDDYRARSRSPLVLRAPRRLTLGSGIYCQTTALAFDGAALLPPFFPSEPGEDMIFGRLLRLVSPDSLIAYHPCAVSHVPVEVRAVATVGERSGQLSGRASAGHVPLHALMAALLDVFTPLPGTSGAAALLDALGRYFLALGPLPADDLEYLMKVVTAQLAARQLRALERELAHPSSCMPPAYREDLRLSIERWLSLIDSHEVLPKEFLAGRTSAEALAFMQRQLTAFGRLCAAWPSIVAASSALNAEGKGLGVRV